MTCYSTHPDGSEELVATILSGARARRSNTRTGPWSCRVWRRKKVSRGGISSSSIGVVKAFRAGDGIAFAFFVCFLSAVDGEPQSSRRVNGQDRP
jgi:hypothetical protein